MTLQLHLRDNSVRVPTKEEIMIEMMLDSVNQPHEDDLQQTALRELLRQHLISTGEEEEEKVTGSCRWAEPHKSY